MSRAPRPGEAEAQIRALRELHQEPAINGRPAVFEYQLTEAPGWLVMISRPGTGIDAARERLTRQYGTERLQAVRRVRVECRGDKGGSGRL